MERKWLALGALALGLFVVGLDLTILNVALPTLAADLDASTGQLQWFADSYNLVLAATLIPAGLLGDRFGRKRMLLLALTLFGVAWLGCALSDTPAELIAARAVLGFGAAFLMPLRDVRPAALFDPRGAPEGDHRVGASKRARHPARAGDRRLSARPLRLGIGVPDQPAGRRARPDRDLHPPSGIARPAPVEARPARHARVQRRPRRAHLRRDREALAARRRRRTTRSSSSPATSD